MITPRPFARGHESEVTELEPLTVRIATAVQLTGISRSRLYELIETGDLETVKVGRARLIDYKSLKSLIAARR